MNQQNKITAYIWQHYFAGWFTPTRMIMSALFTSALSLLSSSTPKLEPLTPHTAKIITTRSTEPFNALACPVELQQAAAQIPFTLYFGHLYINVVNPLNGAVLAQLHGYPYDDVKQQVVGIMQAPDRLIVSISPAELIAANSGKIVPLATMSLSEFIPRLWLANYFAYLLNNSHTPYIMFGLLDSGQNSNSAHHSLLYIMGLPDSNYTGYTVPGFTRLLLTPSMLAEIAQQATEAGYIPHHAQLLATLRNAPDVYEADSRCANLNSIKDYGLFNTLDHGWPGTPIIPAKPPVAINFQPVATPKIP